MYKLDWAKDFLNQFPKHIPPDTMSGAAWGVYSKPLYMLNDFRI